MRASARSMSSLDATRAHGSWAVYTGFSVDGCTRSLLHICNSLRPFFGLRVPNCVSAIYSGISMIVLSVMPAPDERKTASHRSPIANDLAAEQEAPWDFAARLGEHHLPSGRPLTPYCAETVEQRSVRKLGVRILSVALTKHEAGTTEMARYSAINTTYYVYIGDDLGPRYPQDTRVRGGYGCDITAKPPRVMLTYLTPFEREL